MNAFIFSYCFASIVSASLWYLNFLFLTTLMAQFERVLVCFAKCKSIEANC